VRVIRVIKQLPDGTQGFSYDAQLVSRDAERVVARASFTLPDHPKDRMVIRTGDLFLETYFFHRWYNVFEIHDGSSERVKAWYCNFSRPARLDGDRLSYVDLYLDLIVYPDGTSSLLDLDEFENAALDEGERGQCEQALRQLRAEIGPRGLRDS